MHLRTMLLLLVAAILFPWGTSAGNGDQKPVGIKKRTLWTTSKVKGTPEPPLPYRTELAFPKMRFSKPLDMAKAPGTGRMIIAQRKGTIFSFRKEPHVKKEPLRDPKPTTD